MKKVLVIAFVTVAIANHGWAQTPDARPIVQPGTIAILDTMAIVANSPSVAPARDSLALFQAPRQRPGRAPLPLQLLWLRRLHQRKWCQHHRLRPAPLR
jgi:hypothetical protein